jgi:hypothetical protein
MDDGLGLLGALAKAVQVFQFAAMCFRSGGGQFRRPGIVASHAKNLVAGVDEFLDDGSADKARCTRYENFHAILLLELLRTLRMIGDLNFTVKLN